MAAHLANGWRKSPTQVGDQIKTFSMEAIEALAKLKKAVFKAEGERPIAIYLGLAHKSDEHLSETFTNVAHHHMAEPDVYATCMLMAQWSKDHVKKLKPWVARYREEPNKESDQFRDALFQGPRSGRHRVAARFDRPLAGCIGSPLQL